MACVSLHLLFIPSYTSAASKSSPVAAAFLIVRAMKLLYVFLLLCPSFSLAPVSLGNTNSTDELALLSFKSMLSSSPSSLLGSWNSSSHFCSWPGVVCGRRHPDRVVALTMGSFNLSGYISPFLGNLSFLTELSLPDNQLVGGVPRQLGHLGRLRVLNVTRNYLQGSIPVTLGRCTNLKVLELSTNRLQGEIPSEIATLKNLVFLNLSANSLSGEIPRPLDNLPSIQYLYLYKNRLSGDIPPSLGNLTNLKHLALHENMLSGVIPSSLGLLSSLSVVSLGFNNLSGSVPTSLWNISTITHLSVQHNMLSGAIPPNSFNNVPLLQVLFMDNNNFHGPIPASISNASNMEDFQLAHNYFSGIVPPEIGRLRNLGFLQLNDNLLQANEPEDWEFITALTNCSRLQLLGLASSKFGGVLPDSFSNLSASLWYIDFENNQISGSIPDGIGNLINLEILGLDINLFTGSLPPSLCRLKNLVVLYLDYNNIGGTIPMALGNLTGLNDLLLNSNAFSSTIPNTLGNLTKLVELDISSNYLIGPVPTTIFNIPTLSRYLDISNNNLEGRLPMEIGNLKNLIKFNAESNKLSGEIPTTIGECQFLQYLSLKNNTLNGSIPSLLSQLKGLEFVDLSSNNLSGQIPNSLGNLTTLNYLNLSFNNLSGEVPNFGIFANLTAISIESNDKLCGGINDLHLPTCSFQLPKKRHIFLVIPIVISLVTTLVALPLIIMLCIWHKKRKTKTPPIHSLEGHPLISYSELVRATDGFSETNLLGSGSFGNVYRGELHGQEGEGTNLVAVKVLKLQTPKALQSFTAECEALRVMRHRNLVKIITICSSIDSRGHDFKAIVYDFMCNGNLEGWLHPDTNDQAEQRDLNLLERVTILLDVAYALDYLHCHGPEPVVHCDLKSSNVLLDADMVAHVGDFGLAKILAEPGSLLQSTSSMGVRGTIGYAAPEYGSGNMVSTHGDIYSYGILVLETITGRRPTDNAFGQGLSLRQYVDLALQNRVMDAVDTRLYLNLQNELHAMGHASHMRKMDCLVSLLKLGMSCTQELPSSRMPTEGIIKELFALKDSLLRECRTST